MEFLGQDVGVWDEVKLVAPESLLHLHVVVAESILPGDLIRLREVIDPLELIEALVKIRFATASGPQYVPLVRVGVVESVSLQDGAH